MAHPEHLAILMQGVKFWNAWRDSCPQVKPDLSESNLSDIKLCPITICDTLDSSYEITVNLSNVNFYRTCLNNAQLARANFNGADLREAVLDSAQLIEANFESANLTKALLRDTSLWKANFKEANLKGACLIHSDLTSTFFHRANLEKVIFTRADLMDANFSNTNLEGAILSGTYLVRTNFRYANLNNSILIKAQARNANFRGASLTGCCIEDWNINGANLNEVECRYVYLQYDSKIQSFKDRCPSSGEFAPGEFLRRFQVAQNVIDLTFRDGVPWQALAYAFNESNIQVFDEHGDELYLREYKVLGDGFVTLKISYPPGVDPEKLRAELEQKTHEFEVRVAHLTGELKANNLVLERLLSAPRLHVNSHFHIGDNNFMTGDRTINMGSGNYIESNSGIYFQGDYSINMEQDLAQAASQIQDLIEQLEKKGVSVDVAQEQVAKNMATQAQSNPKMKDKLLKWGQSLGDATVNDVVKGVVKLAIRSAGIPLP
jgi:uncharacterized protein YjbI with pentapeptide repeats